MLAVRIESADDCSAMIVVHGAGFVQKETPCFAAP